MITVRPRVDEDVDNCVAVLHRVHADSGYPRGTNDFRDFITTGIEQAWVAEQDGQIVGHVAVGPPKADDFAVIMWRRQRPHDERIHLLERLYVLPEARKQGVAPALLERAAAYGREKQTRFVLFALSVNAGAIQLYRRLHWEEYGADVWRFGDNLEKEMDAICFASPLTS